jgi:hypothetical protein
MFKISSRTAICCWNMHVREFVFQLCDTAWNVLLCDNTVYLTDVLCDNTVYLTDILCDNTVYLTDILGFVNKNIRTSFIYSLAADGSL